MGGTDHRERPEFSGGVHESVRGAVQAIATAPTDYGAWSGSGLAGSNSRAAELMR